MLSKRVAVVCADSQLRSRVVAGVRAAGAAADSAPPVGEAGLGESWLGEAGIDENRIEADLVFFESTDPGRLATLVTRLAPGTRLVPLVDRPQLDAMVALLRLPQVPALLATQAAIPSAVASLVSRLLEHDLLGVAKFMPFGVRIYSMQIHSDEERAAAVTTLEDFGSAMTLRRKVRELIALAADELVLNALDAVGEATLEYACDGQWLALGVRDRAGALRRGKVLDCLEARLRAGTIEARLRAGTIDARLRAEAALAGPGGFGLYLVASSVAELHFHLAAEATEVVALFDVARPGALGGLRALGLNEELLSSPLGTCYASARRAL